MGNGHVRHDRFTFQNGIRLIRGIQQPTTRPPLFAKYLNDDQTRVELDGTVHSADWIGERAIR